MTRRLPPAPWLRPRWASAMKHHRGNIRPRKPGKRRRTARKRMDAARSCVGSKKMGGDCHGNGKGTPGPASTELPLVFSPYWPLADHAARAAMRGHLPQARRSHMERIERIHALHRILSAARYPVTVQRLQEDLE